MAAAVCVLCCLEDLSVPSEKMDVPPEENYVPGKFPRRLSAFPVLSHCALGVSPSSRISVTVLLPVIVGPCPTPM